MNEAERVKRFLPDKELKEYEATSERLHKQVCDLIAKQPPASVQEVYAMKRLSVWKAREEICPGCKEQTEKTKQDVVSHMAFLKKLPDDHPCLHCKLVDKRSDDLFALYSTRKSINEVTL